MKMTVDGYVATMDDLAVSLDRVAALFDLDHTLIDGYAITALAWQ